MKRCVLSITGSRADYGLMEPIHRAIAADCELQLHLVVTGMHLLPDFHSDLVGVRDDAYGTIHEISMVLGEDSGRAMAQGIGLAILGLANVMSEVKPNIVLLQGDRGEMLAGAIAASHMNIAIVHMSGGDISGSIDDSVRNSISKLAHMHLTSSASSTKRLMEMGESTDRIVETGDPAIDQLRTTDFMPRAELSHELGISSDEPFLLATLHPVTDEADAAATQMTILLEALAECGMRTVFTYPNSDSGGRAMRTVLESWRDNPSLIIRPSLGSRQYLSLLGHAAAMVGNSSSALVEAPFFKVPAVNIGSRQSGRLRGTNVIDVTFDKNAIVHAVRFALDDTSFRKQLASCRSPYGDGRTAERTLEILKRLRLGPALTAKWNRSGGRFLRAPSKATKTQESAVS